VDDALQCRSATNGDRYVGAEGCKHAFRDALRGKDLGSYGLMTTRLSCDSPMSQAEFGHRDLVLLLQMAEFVFERALCAEQISPEPDTFGLLPNAAKRRSFDA